MMANYQAPAPTPAADKTPSTEEKDGGVVMHIPDLGGALGTATQGIVCKRVADASCVSQYAESLVKNAQAAGILASLVYLKSWNFPDPKNELLVTALKETNDFARSIYFGSDVGAHDNVVKAATWIAWGYTEHDLTFSDDLVFSKEVLDAATQEGDADKSCPDEIDTPFCENCGGDQGGKLTDGPGESRGVCIGLGGNYFKGCPCFIDEPQETPQDVDYEGYFQFILSQPDIDEDPAPVEVRPLCGNYLWSFTDPEYYQPVSFTRDSA